MDVFEGLGGPPDIVVVDKVHMRGVADLLPRRVLVFRPTDWFGFSPRSSRADAEHWLCRHADLIVSTSTVILDRYRSAGYELPSSSAVLANGVDLDTFKPSTATGPRNEKKAVYVGALDDRFDFDAVCAAADSRPDWSFDLYGPASERLTRTPRPGNVRLPGALPYAQVPNVLRDSTVGLLPLNQSEANEARSPMKYYEYRATGLPIVASRTAELESRTDPGLFLYDAHQHLADALDLAEKAGHSELPGIETHGWGTIIDRFEELVMQAAGE
jgi:glycosyltransferase involved in cell wall biosynthesis